MLTCLAAATGLAAGSTSVEHFSQSFPANVCGFSGTVDVHGTSIFRDTGDGTYFMTGASFHIFTATNGKSATVSFAGPQKQTTSPVIDERAETVTITTTFGGLFEKLSLTGGPTLNVDAGPATFVDVFEYTGDPNNPVGDFISTTLSGLHGPHPDLVSGFALRCDILAQYLQGP
jgi:hypothetical protein